MKLSSQNIQFIDTYLKNSDIQFIDVRMEMVDHVASEVEAMMEQEQLSFYNAFKHFMVLHKKELQKTNDNFTRATDKKVLCQVASRCVKPSALAVFIAVFLLLQVVADYWDPTRFARFLPVGLLMTAIIFYYFLRDLNKSENRFSGLERVGLVLFLFFQIVQLFFSVWGNKGPLDNFMNINFVFIALMAVVTIAFMQTIVQLKKQYHTQYSSIIK